MVQRKTYERETRGYAADELFVKRLDDLTAARTVLTKETYFEGGDVLVCHAGRFRFSFKGENESIVLAPGEILVLYPGNTVTIESLARNGNLKYAIFGGTRVAGFFDSFGFYDRLHFTGNTQVELFDIAVQESATDIDKAFGYICDALRTFARVLQTGKAARRHRTLHAFHRAVCSGQPGLKAICDQLSVSRSTLNRTFAEAKLGNPNDHFNALRFRHARQLLQTTELPIAKIAKALGFSSSVYFTEFIRKHAEQTPTELRKAR